MVLLALCASLAVLSFVQGVLMQWKNGAVWHALPLYFVAFILVGVVHHVHPKKHCKTT